MKVKEILSTLSLMALLGLSLVPANAQTGSPGGNCDPSCKEAIGIFFWELKPDCKEYECEVGFKDFVNTTLRWKMLCTGCNFKELYDSYRKTNKRPYPYDVE